VTIGILVKPSLADLGIKERDKILGILYGKNI
jgi:hypothetical protein